MARRFRRTGEHRPGCSKWPSSKAAASEEARRTLRYVELLSDARTMLADFFNILPTLSKRSLYGHAIGRMGSRSQWRKSGFHYRYAPVPHSVRADLRHFLFLGYFATT